MITLRKLHFLIHGFCYAECLRDSAAPWADEAVGAFWRREAECAARWREGVEGMATDEALVIIPFTREGSEATREFEAAARERLKDRCLVLDCPRVYDAGFWPLVDPGDITADLRDALRGQGADWNKEELDTALQCRGCVGQLRELLAQRGLDFVRTVQAEAWGASFEGCVTKYSTNLRRLLALAQPIEIDYPRTVPDAAFLLEATWVGRVAVTDDLRLFLWQVGDRPVGLFARTSESLADRPVRVRIAVDPGTITVLGKQGGRLWPLPAEEKTPPRGPGLFEPPQDLVTLSDGQLAVPVNHGMVWRLAKAPAYLMGPPQMAMAAFRELLMTARTV